MESVFAAFIATLLSFTQPYATDHGRVLAQRDTMCLAETIYHEGRGEQVDGGAAVAFVALNRSVLKGKSPCQIIHARYQFSSFNARRPKPIRELDAWKFSAYLAVYSQLGLIPNPIGNATSYNTTPVKSWLDDNVVTGKVGHHYFYTLRDQLHAKPLYPTQIANQPAVPRLIVYNSERENRAVNMPRYRSVTTQDSTERMREAVPSRLKENAIVRLPSAVPFPEEPSLSQEQVVSLVSAMTPTLVRTLYEAPRVAAHPFHRSDQSFEHHHHKRRRHL